jgi:hypothetical protein
MKDYRRSSWSVRCRERDVTERRLRTVVQFSYRVICVVTKLSGGILRPLQIDEILVSIEASS